MEGRTAAAGPPLLLYHHRPATNSTSSKMPTAAYPTRLNEFGAGATSDADTAGWRPLEIFAAGPVDEAAAGVAFESANDSAELCELARPDDSRRNLFKSARNSAADWHRRSRSFSSALLTIRSHSAGACGFSRTGETGARRNIPSKIAAEVSP